MDEALLKEIVEIARECGAHLMVDEVYRHLTQEDVWSPSATRIFMKKAFPSAPCPKYSPLPVYALAQILRRIHLFLLHAGATGTIIDQLRHD